MNSNRHSPPPHRGVNTLVPGMMVRHPTEEGWGIGQVQSVIGNRITVNFEHAGKQLINGDVIALVPLDDA
jgi:FKBP-type peptidyl-prolyl cis-trans isomerase 2